LGELKVLEVAGNRLVAVAPEVCLAKKLVSLDLNCNLLEKLPPICDLVALENLDLGKNKFT
jgi:Leucine-rich repeat (LRR) protein